VEMIGIGHNYTNEDSKTA